MRRKLSGINRSDFNRDLDIRRMSKKIMMACHSILPSFFLPVIHFQKSVKRENIDQHIKWDRNLRCLKRIENVTTEAEDTKVTKVVTVE